MHTVFFCFPYKIVCAESLSIHLYLVIICIISIYNPRIGHIYECVYNPSIESIPSKPIVSCKLLIRGKETRRKDISFVPGSMINHHWLTILVNHL